MNTLKALGVVVAFLAACVLALGVGRDIVSRVETRTRLNDREKQSISGIRLPWPRGNYIPNAHYDEATARAIVERQAKGEP